MFVSDFFTIMNIIPSPIILLHKNESRYCKCSNDFPKYFIPMSDKHERLFNDFMISSKKLNSYED